MWLAPPCPAEPPLCAVVECGAELDGAGAVSALSEHDDIATARAAHTAIAAIRFLNGYPMVLVIGLNSLEASHRTRLT